MASTAAINKGSGVTGISASPPAGGLFAGGLPMSVAASPSTTVWVGDVVRPAGSGKFWFEHIASTPRIIGTNPRIL